MKTKEQQLVELLKEWQLECDLVPTAWNTYSKIINHIELESLRKKKSEDELDLIQYVTNMLYFAFHFKGPTKADFDKWVEEQTALLSEFASQSKEVTLPGDEDINAFYPLKSETKALSMEYIIRQEGKREGAKAMRDGKIKPPLEAEKDK